MRVLLVDDEALALDRLRHLLRRYRGRRGGRRAPATATRRSRRSSELTPDLVILDVQMPGKNGLRAAADIDIEPRPEIVFVTAHEHYAPDAFEVDAADYLLKPVRFDRLRQAVDRARAPQDRCAPPRQRAGSSRRRSTALQVRRGAARARR